MKQMKKMILAAAAIVAAAFIISTCAYQLIIIRGNSMYPTLHSWQFCVVDKHSRTFERGDVISFRAPELHAVLVKRIAGCPGDSLVITDGKLIVNGAESTLYADETIEYAGLLAEETVLGPDEYAVLGDNLPKSKDSRFAEVGIVRAEEIRGRLVGI